MNKQYLLLELCLLLLLLILIATSSLIPEDEPKPKPESIITLEDITNTQYEYVLKAMMDLKPEYVNQINKVTFSGNQSWVAMKCNSTKVLGGDTNVYNGGCHYSRSNRIYVYIDKYQERFRKFLCHELIHEIIKMGGDAEEDLAYLIDDSGICYEDRRRDINIFINNSNLSHNSTIVIEEDRTSRFIYSS